MGEQGQERELPIDGWKEVTTLLTVQVGWKSWMNHGAHDQAGSMLVLHKNPTQKKTKKCMTRRVEGVPNC